MKSAALILVLTLLAYLPVLGGGYIWDDDDYVTTNAALRTPAGLVDIWLHPHATPQYYPLVFTSFWIEHAIWGLHPAGYHVVNVLLHAIAAILLWRVLLMLDLPPPAALIAACVFAVHPVNVESVAWITERKNVLSAVFYFASAWMFLRGKLWVALALFACALVSKSVTCSLPAALLLVFWWKQRRPTRRETIVLVAMFIIGLALAINTAVMERTHVAAVGAEWNYTLIDRILIAGRAVWFYVGKLVLPIQLSFIYPKWTIAPSAFYLWTFPLAVGVALLVLWLQRDRWGRGPIVAALFFVGTLVPALGFFNIYPMRYTFVADHYVYIASVGLMVPLALAIARAGRVGWIGVIAVLIVLAMFRSAVFRDIERLWRDTLAKNPNSWMVHLNLAKVLDARGQDQEALDHFLRQAELGPDVPDTHMDLGTYLANHRQFEAALEQYRWGLRLNPHSPPLHYHLGRAYERMGRFDEATAAYQQALTLRPDYPLAHLGMSRMHFRAGQIDQAQAELDEARRLDPNIPPLRLGQ